MLENKTDVQVAAQAKNCFLQTVFGCFERHDSPAIPLYKLLLAGRGENLVLSSLKTVISMQKRETRAHDSPVDIHGISVYNKEKEAGKGGQP